MPTLFVGHGNPMNALSHNAYTEAWAGLGVSLPRPTAILCVSAHWFVPGTGVTIATAPRTIHDFGGFPRELYAVRYAAPGDPVLAARVQRLLAPLDVARDPDWGLDHGAWSILCHMYPHADVPVVQLSIDEAQPPAFHYEIGERLAPLRDEGVLILGSGNLVHNLHAYVWGRHLVAPFDWATRFEAQVRDRLAAGEQQPLVQYERLGKDAMLAVPTPDHYLPLLYTIASRQARDAVSFPVEGVDGGSISMLAVRVG
jgi:4,5-DOPA dioxygenase extradiol